MPDCGENGLGAFMRSEIKELEVLRYIGRVSVDYSNALHVNFIARLWIPPDDIWFDSGTGNTEEYAIKELYRRVERAVWNTCNLLEDGYQGSVHITHNSQY